MTQKKRPINDLIESLKERAKELNCLYQVEEILSNYDASLSEVFPQIIKVIPPGWQYPDICQVRMIIEDEVFSSPNFTETLWELTTDIVVQGNKIGKLSIYYTAEMPNADDGPFLKEESKLIQTIAERIGQYIMHHKMRQIMQEWESTDREETPKPPSEWHVVLQMIKQTDKKLYMNISRKILNHLSWSGTIEAEELLQNFGSDNTIAEEELFDEWNRPHQRHYETMATDFGEAAFRIADNYLSDEDILKLIQKWVYEDKLSFLSQVVNRNLALSEVADAIRRYYFLTPDEPEVLSPSKRGIVVSLIRRFLSGQLQYINIAKKFIKIHDFYHLLERVIFTAESHGKLGGKSAGLYLATQILKEKSKNHDLLSVIKIPKTWHITSDVLLHFMHYNNFDEVVEQKYKEMNQIRTEYPHIVQSFKNAPFPADIKKGLSVALDDFGDKPLIVRSSSLLEDRIGAAFSGKYKSLFLANQGTKHDRLEALVDAIAEVYASTFSPDPIEYRAERGLLDFAEEMGIIIQEVVGKRVGKYFLPAFAGVAFSNNEFRWSPRIKLKDGLVRFVPGLGTRAVDRLSDDYPILISPGQPGLRANISADEIYRYSPRKIDVINLEANCFETIEIGKFLEEVGYDFPAINQMISLYKDDTIIKPMGLGVDFEKDDIVVSFEGLIENTPFIQQVKTILDTLEETLNTPVDIEFASDGTDFYLLQCRPQSYNPDSKPAPIPKDLSDKQVVFTANRYVSNGRVPDITHIVYVDPQKYGEISNKSDLMTVGRIISKLNKLLPKRQFILIGPGRWGSRGDIKLGVNVTYSDINNTAVLIEVARKKGNYVPDLSFGTHFFQDLVEANIRYLPLYPDDHDVIFNELFLNGTPNILGDVLPEHSDLADVIRLIDVPKSTEGLVLKVLMNADLDEAVGMLAEPRSGAEIQERTGEIPGRPGEIYWRWRLNMVEQIASELDPEFFGVAGLYVFGSTKNASAGPGSDIDLLIHFRGTPSQREQLSLWLDGWSRCLAEMNYLRTGYRTGGLLDFHFVTDEDIANKTSFASKIGAVTDAARQLRMKNSPD